MSSANMKTKGTKMKKNLSMLLLIVAMSATCVQAVETYDGPVAATGVQICGTLKAAKKALNVPNTLATGRHGKMPSGERLHRPWGLLTDSMLAGPVHPASLRWVTPLAIIIYHEGRLLGLRLEYDARNLPDAYDIFDAAKEFAIMAGNNQTADKPAKATFTADDLRAEMELDEVNLKVLVTFTCIPVEDEIKAMTKELTARAMDLF